MIRGVQRGAIQTSTLTNGSKVTKLFNRNTGLFFAIMHLFYSYEMNLMSFFHLSFVFVFFNIDIIGHSWVPAT